MARTGQMKERIFSGMCCEQIVYTPPRGTKDPKAYDPEKQKKSRFPDVESYEKFKSGISFNTFSRAVNTNMAEGGMYSTLTFDNDWEVHTFDEAKRIRKNYVGALKRKCPDAVIFLVMGRGKGTDRIHFHMISTGIPNDVITSKWKYGKVVRLSELREHNYYDGVDHGRDCTGLCRYLYDHWTEEVGGHHWFQTKNARKPEKEEPTEVRVTGGYSEKRPPIAPKGYKLVQTRSTPYGYLYFKYVMIPDKGKHKTKNKRIKVRLD